MVLRLEQLLDPPWKVMSTPPAIGPSSSNARKPFRGQRKALRGAVTYARYAGWGCVARAKPSIGDSCGL